MALRVEGTRLVGDDDRFRYEFEASASTANGADQRSEAGNTTPRSRDQPGTAANDDRGTAATPPYPTAIGAYVLNGDRWETLPQNHARIVQTTAQALLAKQFSLDRMFERWTGKSSAAGATPAGDLTFDGADQVPYVPGRDVVLAYVGTIPPLPAAAVAKYDELRSYPMLELAPVRDVVKGTRYVPLYPIAPGFLGFGATRVTGTIEHPNSDVTVLRCADPLKPGRYGFSAGAQNYELGVE